VFAVIFSLSAFVISPAISRGAEPSDGPQPSPSVDHSGPPQLRKARHGDFRPARRPAAIVYDRVAAIYDLYTVRQPMSAAFVSYSTSPRWTCR
jgi:hypothetical protein